ncbi:hypothetical protein BOTBODRAFT_169082 [Botryobasidium botryosum FD-172 SS1]|uniref:DOCKER domain-containing protein n=1 Tax=Botryobasidium botryosum (strain FD-172 SS1) TaxID=930990 RepID=A0A067NCS2_BOTB1|nr:hypothetical protein BOTBODRAFT_169082 [Botryobasidium botryosum FD-172 SS1]
MLHPHSTRDGSGVWEPLPYIIYGFAIHSLTPNDPRISVYRKSVYPNDYDGASESTGGPAPENPFQATLEVGDEVYAFEKFTLPESRGGNTWYRGYVVSTSRQHTVSLSVTDTSTFNGASGSQSAPVTSTAEEPQVTIGIFPAAHIHVRDQLADAEGRLADHYQRFHANRDSMAPYPNVPSHLPGRQGNQAMEPLPEDAEMVFTFLGNSVIPSARPRSNRSTVESQPTSVNGHSGPDDLISPQIDSMRPPLPRPSLKSGDDTQSGAEEPLVDEIASALREWHALLFTLLARRNYPLFNSVRDHIEALHLGRRQLLSHTLSREETDRLRRDCIARLVRGNVSQGLDIIARHPTSGGLVTIESDGGEVDLRSWMSAVRMYSLQVQLAYIDGALPPAGGVHFATHAPRLSATFSLDLRDHGTLNATTQSAFQFDLYPKSPTPTRGLTFQSNGATSRPTPSGFYHVYLDLRAFVASPCLPGETAELFFSLYRKSDAQFLTEEYCAVLTHNGVPARGSATTLFTDLGHHEIQEPIYLVCRIVRNGAMKLSSTASSSTISPTVLKSPGANASTFGLNSIGEFGEDEGYHREREGSLASDPLVPTSFRRPFGCAVLELTELRKLSVEKNETSTIREHSIPIFVPSNESTYSTLHQDLIAGRTKEYEKSSRAEMVVVTTKVFYGDSATVLHENPSLLQDQPITARLGFPDVVFPGNLRNEVYIKLWSGEFFASSGFRKGVASFAGASVGPCNVQVAVEVRTRTGQVVERALSLGIGEPPVTRFYSMVFHNNTAPTFGELIKLYLHEGKMKDCHLFFTFRYRSGKDKPNAITDMLSDRSDRPFAYAYLPLFTDTRAFLPDGSHTLVLYRMDRSVNASPKEYYGAPATMPPGQKIEGLVVPPALAKSVTPVRDSLVIRSFLCSTKYTHNAVLLGLLNWDALPDKQELCTVLNKFTFVGEVEIVKFLQDIFDSLFDILVAPINQHNDLDDLVFNALVTVLGIVQDRRFNNFQPVLDVYIEQHFKCASAASHILHSMSRLLSDPTSQELATPLRAAFKVWHYIFKFIVRARQLQRAKEVGMGATSEHLENSFKHEIMTHLREVNKLMGKTEPSSIIGTQTIALQHFPSILPDLAQVFTHVELAPIATAFANALAAPKPKTMIWKLMMYLQLVRGLLFDNPQSRATLVESIVVWIRPRFGRYDEYAHTLADHSEQTKDGIRVGWLESTRICITIIAVMMDKLQQCLIDPAIATNRKLLRQEQGNVEDLLSLLPRILESYRELQNPASLQAIERHKSAATTPTPIPITFPASYPFSLVANSSGAPTPRIPGPLNRDPPPYFHCALGETAVVFLVLILASPQDHILKALEHTFDIEGKQSLTRLLTHLFSVSLSILDNDAFPITWLNVNIMAHKVLLKVAAPVASILTREYIPEQQQSHEFDASLWRDAFCMILKLLSSDQLVIEEFSPQKRRAVWRLAGDIRGDGARILLDMWTAIGHPKSPSGSAVPFGGFQSALISLVDQVLNLCLSHHDQLRTNAVHILYSMIVSEYHLKEHFNEIESELINKLDKLFMSETKGDGLSRAFFISQLRSLFDSSAVDEQLRARVFEFLDSVDLFLELLLSLRELPDGDEYQDDRVIATLRLLNFIRKIGRDEIYIKYVHQLVNMHLQSQNYVEAALTLKLHSDLHDWNLSSFVDPLPELELPRQSQFARKETLCLLILDYLGKGKAWESAIEICQELALQHSEVTFNYQRLSEILTHQATLLNHIVNEQRYYPEYFRVAFYGGFPAALRDKQFIYRGYEWEKFSGFCERMLQKHPGAQLLKHAAEPIEAIRFSTEQYIQCVAVVPEPDRTTPIFTNPEVPPPIRAYYEHSAINLFSSSRPFSKQRPTTPSEFQDVWVEKTYYTTEESFPTVLRRSEVVEIQSLEISPVENALNDIKAKSKELANLEAKYGTLAKTEAALSTNALSMSLNGAVDAPVNGGVALYRQAFLSPDFVARNPEQAPRVQELRDAIDEQVQIIDRCLKLHGSLCPPEMSPFHETLEKFFRKNFHDEIQRLPIDSHSDQISTPNSKTHSYQGYPGSVDETADPRKRSMSSSVTAPTFAISSQQFSRSAPSLYLPPATAFRDFGMADTGSPRSPLQRNLAHLVRHGMNGISSAPADRSLEFSESRSESPPLNESGSFVNVIPATPPIMRDTPMITPTKGRFSRIGSILRKER